MFKRRVAEPNVIKQPSRRHESESVKKVRKSALIQINECIRSQEKSPSLEISACCWEATDGSEPLCIWFSTGMCIKKCIRNALRAGSYSAPWLLKVIKMMS